jgi:hypothetical protein
MESCALAAAFNGGAMMSDGGQLVGYSRRSGLLIRSVWTAGPDGVREQGPIGFVGYHAYDVP